MNKLLIALCSTLLLSACIQVESGYKVGIPTKVGSQGFWCSNPVGSIQRGGFSAGSGVGGSAFDFVLTSGAAKDALQQALDTQQEVKVHYHRDKWLLSFCLPKDAYLVDSVEGVAKK